jgi:hypothetical protein
MQQLFWINGDGLRLIIPYWAKYGKRNADALPFS